MSWSSTGSSYGSPDELLAEVRRRLSRLGIDDVEDRLRQPFELLGDKSLIDAIGEGTPVWRIDRVVGKLEELHGNRNVLWYGRSMRPAGGDDTAIEATMGELLFVLDPTRNDGGAQPAIIGRPAVLYSNAHGGLVSPAGAQGPEGLLWRLDAGPGATVEGDVIVPDGRRVSVRLTGAIGRPLEVVGRRYLCNGQELAVTGMSETLARSIEDRLDGTLRMLERGGDSLTWILDTEFDAS